MVVYGHIFVYIYIYINTHLEVHTAVMDNLGQGTLLVMALVISASLPAPI